MADNTQDFTFTDSAGKNFKISAPAGTSFADAQAFFEKQNNSGALTNLGIGQTLEGLSKTVAGALGQIDKLSSVAVGAVASAASILKQIPATSGIGSLDPSQVTGLIAQAAKTANQALTSVSAASGIGKFGISPGQLEQQGFIKPGAIDQFLKSAPAPVVTQADIDEAKALQNAAESETVISPEQVAQNKQLNTILSSPIIWAGKAGVGDLTGFLSDPKIQNLTQQNVLSKGFNDLKSLGVATGKETAEQLSAMVSSAGKFGATDVAAWAKGKAPPELVTSINALSKDAQAVTSLITSKLGDLGGLFGAGALVAASNILSGNAVGTVNRASIDAAIKGFVGSDKVPAPTYGELKRKEEAPADTEFEKFKEKVDALIEYMVATRNKVTDLYQELQTLEAANGESLTFEEIDAVDQKYQIIRNEYNTKKEVDFAEINKLYKRDDSQYVAIYTLLLEQGRMALSVASAFRKLRDELKSLNSTA